MKVFDLNQQLWPAGFIRALRARRRPPRLDGDRVITVEGARRFVPAEHQPERRLDRLDGDGITTAVLNLEPLGLGLLAAGEAAELRQLWADGIGELVAAADGRFAALAPGRVLPGFAGVSVPASQLLAELDDVPRVPVLTAAADAGVFVLVQPELRPQPTPVAGLPGRPTWWAEPAEHAAQLQQAYLAWCAGGRERHPALRIGFTRLAGGAVLMHELLGGSGVDPRALLDPQVYLEVSGHGRLAIELCLQALGVRALLYGSGAPGLDPARSRRAIGEFGEAVVRHLQTENPLRALNPRDDDKTPEGSDDFDRHRRLDRGSTSGGGGSGPGQLRRPGDRAVPEPQRLAAAPDLQPG